MKKGSMLTALLLAMVMLVSSAFAELADVLPEGGVADAPAAEESTATGDQTTGSELMLLSDYNSEAKAPALYGDLITNYDDLDALYYAVEKACTNNLELVSSFTALQVAGVLTRTNDLYEESTAEDKAETREMIYDMLMIATGSVYNDAMMLAAGGLPVLSGELPGGTYQLTDDVTLTGTLEIKSGTTVTLDLNGFVLSGSGDSRVILNDGELTIIDSNPTKSNRGSLKTITITRRMRGETNTGPDVTHLAEETRENILWSYSKTSGSTVIKGGVITNGVVMGNGAGIDNRGTLKLEGGTIAGCHATLNNYYEVSGNKLKDTPNYAQGGAIYNNGTLTINGADIKYNRADMSGGGVANRHGGTFTFQKGTISYNTTTASGGGVNNQGSGASSISVTIFNFGKSGSTSVPVIEHNRTEDPAYTGNGAGIHVQFATLNFNKGKIIDNTSKNSGGGIYSYIGSNILASGSDCIISDNTAGGSGGGICQQYGNVNLTDCTISGNTASGWGGGIYLRVGDITLTDVTINGNKASSGGGIYAYARNDHNPHDDDGTEDCTMTMRGGTISDNKATGTSSSNGFGGGVYISIDNSTTACVVDIEGGTFSGNTATKSGGGIYLRGGDVTIRETSTRKVVISENTATSGYGGALYLENMHSTSSYKVTGTDDKGNPIYSSNFVHDTPINFTINGGTVEGNTAGKDGGAVYIKGGETIEIGSSSCSASHSHPTFQNNEAVQGGAIAVNGGSPILYCGTLHSNKARSNGGAVYVSGGSLTMKSGTLSENTATAGGGAVYMNGGNFTMYYGTVNENEANNGGAVYMAGSSAVFTMESGFMNENKAKARTLAEGEAEDADLGGDGGAIYASGGTLYIGIKDCTGGTDTSRHAANTSHPEMKGNEAADCGGAIAISKQGNTSGTVHLYCCDATGNEALYKGTGKNIFMDGGDIYLYNGANIGLAHDPDLVIIGGELHNMITSKKMVTINYYDHQQSTEIKLQGLVEENTIVNLPDAEYFTTAPAGKTFVGWTTQGGGVLNVRDKSDYEGSGEPYTVIGDGSAAPVMNLYAVWMPSTYKITYVDEMTRTVIAHAPAQYTLIKEAATITIPAPAKTGYAVVGYYIYQDLEQDANWGDNYEPVFVTTQPQEYTYDKLDLDHENFKDQYLAVSKPGADLVLDIGDMKFGDITMVAVFEPQFAKLSITKAFNSVTADDSLSYIFHVVGDSDSDDHEDVDMYVTVQGDGSVTLAELPVGSYTVTEMNDWSWRYAAVAAQTKDVKNPEVTTAFTFTNSLDPAKTKWLDDEDGISNNFATGLVTEFE